MPQVTKQNGIYISSGTYAEQIPKSAGFRWNPQKKNWWTDSTKKAATLLQYTDNTCREELQEYIENARRSLEMSRASDTSDYAGPNRACSARGIRTSMTTR